MVDWEDTYISWGKGPGTTEQGKCENAEAAIRKALEGHDELSDLDITVFAQGSYRNKTNVKQDSDVDICVRLNSTFFPEYPKGKTGTDFGDVDADLTFADYKNLIHAALENYFGTASFTRGDKAFNIHENTYRINADVVPTFVHRRYFMTDDNSYDFHCGIGFDTDAGKRIFNWPEQHFENGLIKHENTGRRYRKMIRILKRMRNEMQDENIESAKDVASCLIESLVSNVPNELFDHDTYSKDVREVIAHIFNETTTDEKCSKWVEVSGFKWLFRNTQPWTREQAHKFISAAWDYMGLE